MKPSDLLLYLIGNRGAIERIAASRKALWAGALLVLSAGVARNYDHLNLLTRPEWIYGPFGMSLFSAVFIWLVLRMEISRKTEGPRKPTFRTWLTLFWLTAPCAWLYGLPVERFTDLLTSTKWNFGFLLVVAAWRVALMVRAVTVLTGAGAGRILSFVLLPACLEMGVGSLWKTISLVGIMGGVRLPPHHEFLSKATGVVVVGSFWLGIASLLAMVFYGFSRRGLANQALWRAPLTEKPGVILTAALAAAGWLAAAVPGQVSVWNNDRLIRFFEHKQWKEGIAYASARQRSDFSAIHYLPPDPFGSPYGGSSVPLLQALNGTEPEWLVETWIGQAMLEFEMSMPDAAELSSISQVLSRYPEKLGPLTKEALHLKSKSTLESHESRWLLAYDEIFRQQTAPRHVIPKEAKASKGPKAGDPP